MESEPSTRPGLTAAYSPAWSDVHTTDEVGDDILALVKRRDQLRRERDFAAADVLRDHLRTLGVSLDDRTGNFKLMTDEVDDGPPRYSTQWHEIATRIRHVALEAYVARSIAWPHVPKLQTYRALLGKRSDERHDVAEQFAVQLSAAVDQSDASCAVLCIEKPYIGGFVRGYRRAGSGRPFVLLAINGGDTPVTAEMQAELLSLPGLRACYAHNLHTPPSAQAAERMHPLPLGALPLGSLPLGDAWLREAREGAAPWARRDRRLLVAPMKLNSRLRERYLEVLRRPEYSPLVRVLSERLPLPEFLEVCACARDALRAPSPRAVSSRHLLALSLHAICAGPTATHRPL